MTTIMKIKGANFEGVGSSFAPAVTADLAGWWYPNGTISKAAKNLAPGRAAAAVVGSPTVGVSSIALDGVGDKYLATAIPEAESMTFIAVIRSSDTQVDLAHRPYFMTTIGGFANADTARATSGISLVSGGANLLQFSSARWNGAASSSQAVSVACSYGKWSFVVGRAGPLVRHLWNVTDGVAAGGATSWQRDPANGTVRLGKRVPGSATADGLSDMAFAGVYSRYLSDTEVAAIYAQVKKYLGDLHGISI